MTSHSLFHALFNHSAAPAVPHSISDVSNRLAAMKVSHDDIKMLVKNEVDGDCLGYLTDDALARIGVPTLGRRVKILRAAQTIIAEYQASTVLGSGHGHGSKSGAVAPATPPTPKRSLSATLKPSTPASRDTLTRPKTADAAKEKEKEKDKLSKSHEVKREAPAKKLSKSRGSDSESDDDAPSKSAKSKVSAQRTSSTSKNHGHHNASDDSDEDISVHGSDSEIDSDTDRERDYSRAAKKQDVKKTGKASGNGDDEDDLFATSDAGAGSEFMAVKPWLGAIVPPSKLPKMDPSPPDSHLKLEWVHGYRAFDSRSNTVYNDNSDIVYPVAGVIVVYSTKTKKQKHFMGHNDDVRCLSQHPLKRNWMVSGQNATIVKGKGNPPHICVWDSTDFTKSYMLKLTQEDRAVRAVSFSGDGKYVISVSNDDNHSVKLWDWEAKKLLVTVKGDTNPIYAIKGNHRDAKEFVSVGKRHAVFWNYDSSTNKLLGKKAAVNDKNLSFYSVCFSEKGYACLGGEDGSIYVYVSGKPIKTFTNLHTGKVLTLDYYSGGIVSGGSDNTANVLDKKMEVAKKIEFSNKVNSVFINEKTESLLVGTMGSEIYEVKNYSEFEHSHISDSELEPITTGHSDGELWALSLSTDNRTYVTVGEDNTIAVWDVATHKCLRKATITDKKGKKPKILRASTTSTHPVNQCARAVSISPNNKHIAIGLNTGELAVYEYKSLKLLYTTDLNSYGKRNVSNQKDNWIQCLRYSPSGHVLAVGTHGSVVCLCDVSDNYAVKGVAKSSNSFITHIDWNEDSNTIQTNDGAYELLYYSINEDNLAQVKQITSASSVKDEKWASITCTLGWGVQGIYDSSQNGQQVNTVDVSGDRALAVTGDDRGNVNLYRYPVPKNAKSQSSHAHSSHVVTTRFTSDQKYVLSTGGHDLAIMQWAVVRD